MKQTDREDALLRTLDLLPESDAARSDPKFTGNRDLLEEARGVRETAIDVWLTASPLTAAPAEIHSRIMAQLPSASPASRMPGNTVPRRWMAAAAVGWAAAIAIGCAWWFHPEARSSNQVVELGNDRGESPSESEGASPAVSPRSGNSGQTASRANDRKIREDAARLRQALEEEFRQGRTPRVKELSRPGALAKNPEESQQRLRKLLVDALRSSLEAKTGAPGDPATMVIERGWPVQGGFQMEPGTMIRHRNFPENSWQELGLLKADDGSYYDPSGGMIWTPDPEQRGFIGRASNVEDDLGEFRAVDDIAEPQPESMTQSEPGGFLIESPEDGSAQVVIEGVPQPGEGQTHWVVWTNPDGSTTEHPVVDSMITGSGTILDQAGFIGSSNVWSGPFSNLGGDGLGSGIVVELQVRGTDGLVIETVLQGGN